MYMLKNRILLALFVLVFCNALKAQTIVIDDARFALPAGQSYSSGGSVAVPFTLNGCFSQTNIFTWTLCDAAGAPITGVNAASGTASYFYATFINTVLPAGLNTGSYRIRITSSTLGATGDTTNVFNVTKVAGTPINAKAVPTNALLILKDQYYYGVCDGGALSSMVLRDSSTAGGADTVTLIDDYRLAHPVYTFPRDVNGKFNLSFTPQFISGKSRDGYYTAYVKTVGAGNVVSTIGYQIINNSWDILTYTQSKNSNAYSCKGDTIILGFEIDRTQTAHLQQNYPGALTKIAWNDGTSEFRTQCDILAVNGKLSHFYSVGACNSPQNNFSTSYTITTTVTNPFNVFNGPGLTSTCAAGAYSVASAFVFSPPTAKFNTDTVICALDTLKFKNISDPGQGLANQGSITGCAQLAHYTWVIDHNNASPLYETSTGNVELPKDTGYYWLHSQPGYHDVTLFVNNDFGNFAPCPAHDTTKRVCVDTAKVRPDFQLDSLGLGVYKDSIVGCAPVFCIKNNTKSTFCVDSTKFKYKWRVLDANSPGPNYTVVPNNNSAYTYTSGKDTSRAPCISISKSGRYFIELNASATCQVDTSLRMIKYVEANGSADVNFPLGRDTVAYCGYPSSTLIINYNPTAPSNPLLGYYDSVHYTYQASAAGSLSYKWTVKRNPPATSPTDYQFIGGTSPTSKYPIIEFLTPGLYVVTDSFFNSCQVKAAVQYVAYRQPVSISAGASTGLIDSVCHTQNSFNITGANVNGGGAVGEITWTIDNLPGSDSYFTPASGSPSTPNIFNPILTFGPNDKALACDTGFNFVIKASATGVRPTSCSLLSSTRKLYLRPCVTLSDTGFNSCSGSPISFKVTKAGLQNAHITWTYTYVGGVVSGATNSGPLGGNAITDILVGNGIVQYTVYPTKDGCVGDPFTVLDTVRPVPSAPTVTYIHPAPSNPAHSMCSGDIANLTMTGDFPSDEFDWIAYNTQGNATGFHNGTGESGSIIDTIFNTIATDTVYYQIKTSSQYGCYGPATKVSVVVTPGPNVAKIYNPAIIYLCDSNCYTIKHNIPGASGIGTVIVKNLFASSLPSVSNPNDSTTILCGLKPDNWYSVKWVIDPKLAGCFSSADSMKFYVSDTIPTPNAGADVVLCDVDGIGQRAVNVCGTLSRPLGGGEVIRWSNNPLSVGGLCTNYSFINRAIYPVVMRVSNNVCIDKTDTMLIRAYGKPLGGSITLNPNQGSYCQGSSISLTANIDTNLSSISQWETAFPTAPNAYTLLPTNINPLNITATQNINYRTLLLSKGWNYGCKDSVYSTIAQINVDSATIAGNIVASDTVVCTPNSVISLTLTNFRGQAASIQWIKSTTIATTGYGSSFALGNPTSVAVTTTTWYRAIIRNGNCSVDTSAPIMVQLPTGADVAVITGSDTAICNATTINLVGNIPVNGNGVWSMSPGQNTSGNPIVGAYSFPTTPGLNTTTQNPVLANISTPGTYVFKWEIKNLTCPGTFKTITVKNTASIGSNTITPSADTVCNGTTVNFTATTPNGGSGTYTYSWQYSTNGGTTWTVGGTNANSYSIIPNTNTCVRRVVKSDSCYDYGNTICITVQPNITNNTITATPSAVCINSLAPTLTGSAPAGGSGSYTYAWDTASNFNLAQNLWISGNTTTTSWTPTTILTQTLNVRRVVVSGKCSDTSAVATITVNPDAIASFVSNPYTSCAPFALVIQTPTPPVATTNHNWYATTGAGVRTSIGTGAGFPGYTIANGLDSIMITEIATSTQGCKTDSLSRWYYTSATPNASFTVSADSGCANNTGANTTTFTFTNTTPSLNSFTYVLDYGNGTASSSPNPLPTTYAPSVTGLDMVYTVTLTATSQFCGSSQATHNINIRTRPKVLFSVSPTYQCSGIADTFTNKTVGSPNLTYAWIFGDAGNTVGSTQVNPLHTYNVNTLTTICPKVIASNECASDSFTNCVVIAANTVTLNMSVKASDKFKCTPDTVTFYSNSVGGTSYVWDFGDNSTSAPSANGIDSVTHIYTKSGKYIVTLTGSTACGSVSKTDSIIAYGTPIVAFSINPNTTICKGDTVHFNNLTDTATSYVWDFGNGTGGGVNPTRTYSATGTYNVSLTAIRTQVTPLGGPISCTAVSGIQTVTVRDTMPAAFTVTHLGKSCLPDTVLFTNTSAITTLPILNTNWSFGVPGATATTSPVTYVYNVLGQYAVKLNIANAGGCIYIDSQFVTVAGPLGSWIHDTGYICGSNMPVHFTLAASSYDSVAVNYGDGTPVTTVTAASFANTFTHIYAVGGTYYPNITLKSVNGCTFQINAYGAIRVDYVKASYNVNPQVQTCGTTVLSFTNTSHVDQLSTAPTYSWNVNGVTYPTTNPSVSFNTTGIYNVRMQVTSVSGCFDSVITTPISVKVNNIPVINSITRQDAACTNQVIYYTANPGLSEDPITNFNWSFGNGTISSGISTQTIYATPGTYTDTLTVVTSAGCTSSLTRGGLVISGTPIVAINPSVDTTICLNIPYPLSAFSSGPIPIATYTWNPVNGGLNTTTGANVIANPTVSTKYIVTGTSANGCSDTASVNVSVVQPYTISVNASPNDSICLGEKVVLTASGATEYTWIQGGSSLDTINGSRVIASPKVTTTYIVRGNNAGSCFPNTTGSVTIAVGDTLHISLGIDTVVLQGGTILPLNPSVVNGPVASWAWTSSTGSTAGLSCNNCGNPIATVGDKVCYQVDATSVYGCKASTDICIIPFCEASQVFIPNAFTPDGNGINDFFYITAVGIEKVLSLRVFNRWGQVVFERSGFKPDPIGTLTPNTLTSWNGKINGVTAPTEVYVYTCEVVCANGTKFTYKGNVALIK